MKKFDLTGKVSVITGATRGIGLGIARVFAENGSELALIGRNSERGGQALEEIKRISKKKSIFYSCDVGEYDQSGDIRCYSNVEPTKYAEASLGFA